jgi:hypothetical protein
MSERIMLQGETMHQEPQLTYVADLPFGEGNIGEQFENEEQRAICEQGLRANIVPITKANTADCVDERGTLGFADGTTDQAVIESRVVHQLPGGLGLGSTKILVAAGIDFLKGTKTLKEAYEKVVTRWAELGFEDAAHIGCGASIGAEASVSRRVDQQTSMHIAGALKLEHPQVSAHFQAIHDNEKQRLEAGFYSTWDNKWHEDYVATKFPQNFATLKTADDATKGHYAHLLNIQTIPGHGLNKNGLIRTTGMQAFNESTELLSVIANAFGETPEEQWRIIFAGVQDLENVGNVLFKKGMPTYITSAA